MDWWTALNLAFPIYGLVSMPLIWFLRWKDMREKLPELTPSDEAYMKRAARGSTVPQVLSYIIVCILTLIALSTVGTYVEVAKNENPMAGWGLLVIYLLGLPLLVIMVIVQLFLVYPKRIRKAEAYAFRTGQASTMLYVQRYQTWLIWVSFTGYFIYSFWFASTFTV
jgi:heme/copper-type cytochrome/quinol oxidase subunit 4